MLRRPASASSARPPCRPLLLVACLLATLTWALPASAQWKWRDAQGQIQYSDRPPPASIPDKNVLQRPGGAGGVVLLPLQTSATAAAKAAADSAASAASAADLRRKAGVAKADAEEAARRNLEAAQRQRADELAARSRAENCQLARDQIRLLQDGARMARLNARGEREVLDDQQRAIEMERARSIAASDCR
ncbi:MAG: hypothetical protein RL722_307 [Pseudomonadota bacterium]|jgi:hypothetical protein